MASFSPPLPAIIKRRQQCPAAASSSCFSSVIYSHRSLPWSTFKTHSRFGRCRAASPGPPLPPPDSESNSKKTATPSSGVASFTKFQDTVQIFFAVLFWMSLFFWSSAWDGKNSGRPNKRPRSRK